MTLFIYDIPGVTSGKTIFREALALAALAALNTTGLLGCRNQHVRTSYTFIRLDMFLGQHPRRLVSAVSTNLQIVSSNTVHSCGVAVLGQKATSTLAPSALRYVHLASDCR